MSHFHNVVIILEKSWQDEARRSSVSKKKKGIPRIRRRLSPLFTRPSRLEIQIRWDYFEFLFIGGFIK